MATADAASGSLGPQYAPDDPTLPKPWKGLIDGNTGFLYYWNPETNITQYEKPEASVPPLPSVPPPSNSLPKLASIPVASNFPLNVTGSHQPSQQIAQEPSYQTQPQQQPCQPLFQQQGELTESPQQRQQPPPSQHLQLQHSSSQQVLLQNTQMPVHQPHQLPNQHMASQAPQHYMPIHLQDGLHQHVPYVQGSLVQPPQVQQQHGFQFSNQQVQQSQGPYQQGQQQQGPQGVQIPNQQQQGQQTLGSQTSLSHGYQVLHQDTQHTLQVGQQQGQQSQGLQSGKQQTQQSQGQQPRFPWMEDALHQDGKLGTLPSPGVASAGHHLPDLVSQVGIPPGAGRTSQSPNQFGGPSMQNTSPFQAQNTGIEANFGIQQQRATAVPNPSSNPIVRPLVGGKTMYGGTQNEIPGNEGYPPSKMERSVMYPHQPRLAALPIPQNQSDPGFHPHFDASDLSGGVSVGPQNTQPNMHGHAAFHNPIVLRPSPGMLGPSDFHNVSAADAYRQHHEVTAMGNDVPLPFMTFEATGFPPEILREMHLAGFSTPTPIQAQTWPVALQNRDIVAIAKTGSGKTLGYLIPAFIHLRHCQNNPQFGPTVLVLAPTRELASQIQDEAFKFGRSSRISCTCLYGGAPKGPQLKEIERGADIVIATPGRLNDFLEMKKISFRQVSFLVVDEADRMLDMGFEPQIRKIVNEIPPHRQTLMYTATWPKEVRKIANDLLKNPVQVNIGSVDELVANKSITQHIEVVAPMDKSRRLEQILRTQERGSKVIIFCSTKRQCDQLARSLGRSFGAASIHGDKSQGERDHVLYQFRTGRAPVLVATDVAARGLDIKDIRVVINFDFPTGIEDYVHRIGRTGRAGATGVAYTFFTDQDWKHAVDLVKVLEGANQRVPPEIREMAGRGGPPLSRPRNEPNRWDSGGGNGGGAGRWNARGGRGGGMREGPSGFAGRSSGGMRDGPGGYGGPAGFGGRGGRQEYFGGRAPRGRGFGGPGGPGGRGRGRHDWSPHDRSIHSDGRKRYDGRRGFGERGRERSYSRSPEMVRTWGYGRSRGRSGSRSPSRSRSRSWSRSRSRSWSSRSRSQSRSRSRERVKRPSGWDSTPAACLTATPITAAAATEAPHAARPVEGHGPSPGAGHEPNLLTSGPVLPTSPGYGNGSLLRNELQEQFPQPDGGSPRDAEHHD